MANTLGIYDPIFYAQEALVQLEKALGLAGRVHRGYDSSPQQLGSTIQIRRPGIFVATPMPSAGVNQDLVPDTVTITLDQWHGVRFTLSDKELTYTKEQIITEHIRPAAYAVADKIDQTVAALYADVPWFVDADTGGLVTDWTNSWRVLFDNAVPQDDLHMMLNGERTSKYLALQAFSQWQGAGEAGVTTQQRGTLGMKYGFEAFSNQNVQTAPNPAALATVVQLQLNASALRGATQIVIKDTDAVLVGVITKGDSLVIAGSTQRYAVTANATAAANLITLNITPPLVKDYALNDNVTLRQQTGKSENMGFHRGAFALAMAPLTDAGNQIGARIATAQDPITNLSLRSSMWYVGDTAQIFVRIDALWGTKTLNPNMAVRLNA
jgi:hypothetical protein